MDDLDIASIPPHLIARILLQCGILPEVLIRHDAFNVLALIDEGKRQWGSTMEVDAFLRYCVEKTHVLLPETAHLGGNAAPWRLCTLSQTSDWDAVDDAPCLEVEVPTALHMHVVSEEARQVIDLVKQYMPRDQNGTVYSFKGRAFPASAILEDTVTYMDQSSSATHSSYATLRQLMTSRIDALKRIPSKPSINAAFIMIGALMVVQDSIRGGTVWSLYLRDFVESPTGSSWRVFSDGEESRISSVQALAAIRGTSENMAGVPDAIRPVYLFYYNQDRMGGAPQPTDAENNTRVITDEDYIFDDDDDQWIPTDSFVGDGDDVLEDDTPCKVCQIAEVDDEINKMFFCDACDLGVHQLCEDPPIAAYEQNIDPWYCRSCSKNMGKEIPPPAVLDGSRGEKRKWEEA